MPSTVDDEAAGIYVCTCPADDTSPDEPWTWPDPDPDCPEHGDQ